MIIGLTGENCAGKGAVADYLEKKGFARFSLSDVIRQELKREGRRITRDSLIKKGNELREKYGAGVLAKMIKEQFSGEANIVIDSIRNPSEVEELRKSPNFFLLYVTAPARIRFERMRERGRESDPKTFAQFLKLEKMEAANKDKNAQQLTACFKMADAKIDNSGTFDELHAKVDKLLLCLASRIKFERPDWDEYFLRIAKVVATRSNCVKRHVAAVIVKDKRIISTGYNGTPRGVKNCYEGGCPRCNSYCESGKNLEECVCSHAEENAIVQAAYHGISVKDSILYTTYSPCLICTKMIINAGIKEVVYNARYPLEKTSIKLLKEAGVKVRKFNFKEQG
ncbi:MAG: deaminase [Candidatus Micrarchaeia archaeon]